MLLQGGLQVAGQPVPINLPAAPAAAVLLAGDQPNLTAQLAQTWLANLPPAVTVSTVTQAAQLAPIVQQIPGRINRYRLDPALVPAQLLYLPDLTTFSAAPNGLIYLDYLLERGGAAQVYCILRSTAATVDQPLTHVASRCSVRVIFHLATWQATVQLAQPLARSDFPTGTRCLIYQLDQPPCQGQFTPEGD